MTWEKGEPAANRKIRLSDDKIRQNWSHIEDTLSEEHEFPTSGAHSIITLTEKATPTGVAGKVSFYCREINDKLELFMVDEDDNDVQITDLGVIHSFASGTRMYFYQDSAPSGWTYYSAISDRVLACKGGTNAYNVSGGTKAGTWSQPTHRHTGPNHRHGMNNHTHTLDTYTTEDWSWSDSRRVIKADGGGLFTVEGSSGPDSMDMADYTTGGPTSSNTEYSTGNTSYESTSDTWRVRAAVGIICTKD